MDERLIEIAQSVARGVVATALDNRTNDASVPALFFGREPVDPILGHAAAIAAGIHTGVEILREATKAPRQQAFRLLSQLPETIPQPLRARLIDSASDPVEARVELANNILAGYVDATLDFLVARHAGREGQTIH